MRIELKKYSTLEDSTIRIYRHYIPFTEYTLPSPLVELPSDTEFYLDDTVELNRLVYYRISVVTGDFETVGPLYTTIKRYYTGPQISSNMPDMVLRGDSTVGKFGTLPLKNVVTIEQALAQLPSCTLIDGVDEESINVEKCIYNGNVLFLFSQPVLEGSLESLYNDGSLFSYGDGKDSLADAIYNALPNKVVQGKITNVNDHSFKLRLMTEDEFNSLYVKLYPNSKLGLLSNRIISNRVEHNYISPIINPYIKNESFKALSLDGVIEDIEWSTRRPVHIVIELLNRGEMNWPEPTLVVTVGDTSDEMYFSQAEIINDRIHLFGGLDQISPNNSTAITKHISYALDGSDKKEHAPLPVGVYKAVTWTHGNKIFCYGGVKVTGTTVNSYQELYDDIQVWEDDGTPTGTWTLMNSSEPFNFGSSGSIYYDKVLDKNMIMVMGGYNTLQPNTSNSVYIATLDGFNGGFTKIVVDNDSFTGDGIFGQHQDSFIWVSPSDTPDTSNRLTYTFSTPNISNPSEIISPTKILLQGTELGIAKYGKFHTYHDTVFLCTDTSVGVSDNQMFIYQYVPSERRWLKIIIPVDNLPADVVYSVSCACNQDNIIIYINTPDNTPILYSLTLVDPLDAPIKPVVVTIPENNYIYPLYGNIRQ
ncbi:TPA: hypothetical protein ACGJ7A_005753 [Pseudomonas aeruginosa]